MDKALGNKKAILFFILPPLLISLFSVFISIVWSAVYSLYKGMPNVNFTFVGLKNYGKLRTDKMFLHSLTITLKYVLVAAGAQVGLGFLLSILFAFGIKKYTTIVRTLVFFPVVMPVAAGGQLFLKIFEITPRYGLLNSLLDKLNLDFLIQPWLGQRSTALGVLCTMDIRTAMGFCAVIFYAAFIEIPREVPEAARIDGAKGITLTWYTILPHPKPITLTCIIFSFTGTLKVFESAIALTRSGPGISTKTLSMLMYDTSFLFSQYRYSRSIAVFILAECLFVSVLLNRLFSRKKYIEAAE